MSRLDIQSIESAQDDVKQRLQAAQDNGGFVPNLLGVLANSPAAIEAYQTVGGINGKNGLTPTEVEVVQITAAVVHGCGFCAAGHTKLSRNKLRMDEGVLEALRTGSELPDAKLNALATFTKAVIANRGAVSDDELNAFLEAGYTQSNALDAILGVSLATLCNFANNLSHTPLNPELEPYALD